MASTSTTTLTATAASNLEECPTSPNIRNQFSLPEVPQPSAQITPSSLSVTSSIAKSKSKAPTIVEDLTKVNEAPVPPKWNRPPHSFILGSRSSQLALAQTVSVQKALKDLFPRESTLPFLNPTFEIITTETSGDINQSLPLYLFGGSGDKALWTKELEGCLFRGEVDLVVHSLKDVPTRMPPGVEIAAIMKREDPRDVLVVKESLDYKTLDELPDGSVVGTSSVRRVAQLRRKFPKLKFISVRGNINTRLRKLDAPDSPFSAIILACAGLSRLSLLHRVTSYLSPPLLFPAVGQGALGIEVRTPGSPPLDAMGRVIPKPDGWDDRTERIRDMVRRLNDWKTVWGCAAEREMLRVLEGGCSVPVGVETEIEEAEEIDGNDGRRSRGSSNSEDSENHSPTISRRHSLSSSRRPSGMPSTIAGISTPSHIDPPSLLPSSALPSYSIDLSPSYPLPPNLKALGPSSPSVPSYLTIRAIIASLDGGKYVTYETRELVRDVTEAEKVGREVAFRLMSRGGRDILIELGKKKEEEAKVQVSRDD